MTTSQQQLGAFGEDMAASHYSSRGGVILERNFRYPNGEIDIIVQEPDGTVVFVEVKTRRGESFGGAEAVGRSKMARIKKAAALWLRGKPYFNLRFDVLVVQMDAFTGEVEIDSYEGVDHGAR